MIEVDRLLSDSGVFILVSHGNPDDRLHFLEQYDIEEPYYTPWEVEVQALAKPLEYENEDLNVEDPDNLYFIYICQKREEMVMRKKIRENKVAQDKRKKKPRQVKAPNL